MGAECWSSRPRPAASSSPDLTALASRRHRPRGASREATNPAGVRDDAHGERSSRMPYRDPTGNGPEVLFPGDTIHLSGLKEARLRAGLSRGELARKAHVSLEDIAAIEKTNSRVLVLTAIKIARALGVDLD